MKLHLVFLALAVTAATSSAQTFASNPLRLPSAPGFNDSSSENVDFADVDLDGDWDALFADGGDFTSDQNRLWRNEGPQQTGFFVDVTSSSVPILDDTSRDIEFVDFDGDGDADVYVSNTSQLANQSNRFWLNSGVGSGSFVDETAQRWIDVGQNDGATLFSSIAPGSVLAGGGFIDWSCDCDFADLDNDGDLDLFHSSYGAATSGDVPSRVFLNDGAGFFSEFNPSGFQLSNNNIANGSPALWAEGTHQDNTLDATGAQADIAQTPLDVDLMDTDGDLDIDVFLGARFERPRLFENRLEETGGDLVAFRDVTFARLADIAGGSFHYEQEFGDVDNDGDLDLYGLNFSGFDDTLQFNDGTGNFGPFVPLPGAPPIGREGDFIDFDADGDLDLVIANLSGADQLFENDGLGGMTQASFELAASALDQSLDVEVADLDADGDYDIMTASDSGGTNIFFENLGDVPDQIAPTLYRLEQAPDRAPGPQPTVVRVQVYDNAPYYVTWYAAVTLEYAVDGGAFVPVAMQSSGGQVFRAELPGRLEGQVAYRAFAVDEHGNQSAPTALLDFVATTGPLSYCVSKPSSAGCLNLISTSDPSVHPTSGAGDYSIRCEGVQGAKNGLVFAGIGGPAAQPFSGGTLCVAPPLQRGPIVNSGGSNPVACDGTLVTLVNDGEAIPGGLDAQSGNSAWYQWWYRDPQNGEGTLGSALSDAIRLDFQ